MKERKDALKELDAVSLSIYEKVNVSENIALDTKIYVRHRAQEFKILSKIQKYYTSSVK